ncbi:hypothetical protein BC832DRAFT_386575 [Gaertneriomyces semiglobifer]|nr:hypothetical protein BC832DRAFT_386575 [Gaertneriomyces semiglobifer]
MCDIASSDLEWRMLTSFAQESFRAMFPNINVSFANGNLSEGEAQWGDSFSPSKLGVQESSTSDSWAQGQAFNPLRSQAQMPYQQTPALRGTGAFAGLSLQQQEQLLQQQQYLSSIGNTQQLPPQMINQLQQLRLLQQRQQQQQQQQQFPGLQHSIHPHQQPQEDQLGQYLREAQLRETLLRQEQLRDLQMRGTAQGRGGDLSFRDPAVMAVKMNAAGSGVAPGFEGRGRLGPSQSQALAYQQDWPPSPGASVGLGQGYANNGEYTWGIRGVRSRG